MKPRVLEIFKRLIAFETVSADSNLALIEYVRELLLSKGIESLIVKDESGRKANLFASTGPRDVPGILLSGHTDVVPAAGQAWTLPAFQATLRDGRLYGRGSCDMKGFIALAIDAMLDAADASLSRPLQLALSHDEEIGCVGVRRLLDVLHRTFSRRSPAARSSSNACLSSSLMPRCATMVSASRDGSSIAATEATISGGIFLFSLT
jgi:acetylornithine deacetylase